MSRNNIIILAALAMIWSAAVAVGSIVLLRYEFSPGQQIAAPFSWPTQSSLHRDTARSNLLLFLHPRCPCSRATIGELALLMAQAGKGVSTRVIFVQPPGLAENWASNGLMQAAKQIPGVSIEIDETGKFARHFHAATSGETLLYARDGSLLFNGGITGSRGHSGDNIGRTSLVSLINTGRASQHVTPVFGCSLFSLSASCCDTSCTQ